MSASMQTQSARTVSGVVGFFNGPDELLEGMRKLKNQNYEHFDSFSPFPVHGMDDAQGLKPSLLPYITFLGGTTGFITACLLTMYTSAHDWPLIVGGKDFNSWQAFVPILFELTVLLSALFTFGGMIAMNRLPNITEAAFDPAITSDKFALFIGSPGKPKVDAHDDEALEAWNRKRAQFKKFEENEAQGVLKSIGAHDVRTVYQEGWF